MLKLSFLPLALCFAYTSHGQLAVTPQSNGQVLADLLVGTGTNIQNVQLTCGNGGSGGFANGISAGLGLNDGVVLSTGMVNTIASGAANYSSTAMSQPGDNALDTIIGVSTHDACVLEFDVTVAGTYLMMNYVFASEEYPEFTCSAFNDVFSFQLSGPNPSGPAYQNFNIAQIPGTTLPVSINTVNDQPCDSSSGLYYVSNAASTQVVFDGLTTPMLAVAETTPGQTYHMRFAIADAGDQVYDSGVFLAGGSLKSMNTLANPALVAQQKLSTLQPNPATGSTTLTNVTRQPLDYAVVSMMGQTLRKGTISAGSSTVIDLGGLSTGSYLVRTSTGTQASNQRIEVR